MFFFTELLVHTVPMYNPPFPDVSLCRGLHNSVVAGENRHKKLSILKK